MRCKKRGPRVILTLDDRSGRIEVMLFEETFQKYRDLIAKDALVLVEGQLRFDEFSDAWRLRRRRIIELDKVREQEARRLVLRCTHGEGAALDASAWPPSSRPGAAAPARSPIEYCGARPRGALALGRANGACAPRRELLEQLEAPGRAVARPGAVRHAERRAGRLIRRRPLS